MTAQPFLFDALEQRAADQRRDIHNSVQDLRESVRETLDPRVQVRHHFGAAAGAVAVLGLVLGYGLVSVFKD